MMLSSVVWWFGAFVILHVEPASARPLYMLGDIRQYPGKLVVYDVQNPGEMIMQGEYTIPQDGGGAMGIAIDSNHEFLFFTYEDAPTIRVFNAKTMKSAGMIMIGEEGNLAGIVYDHDKRLLYCADRFKEGLYVFGWASHEGGVLQPKEGSPFTLAGSRSVGIALDEINDLLYVANITNDIQVYRTSDWSFVRTIKLGHPAVSVAVDFNRQRLYTGAGYKGDLDLVRYDLTTGIETTVEISPEAGAIGVAVDNESGLVYITTGRDNDFGGDELRVYSPSLELLQTLFVGGSPTGLVLPLRGFGLQSLGLTLRLVDGTKLIRGVDYAHPGDFLTYEIGFDNNANQTTVTDVAIEDSLPVEVDFVRVEGIGDNEGVYNPGTHSFHYRIGDLEPNATGSFRLVVQVKEGIPAGTKMIHRSMISSNETDSTAATAEVITSYEPLFLSKYVVPDPNHVVVGDLIYVDVGSTLTYEVFVSNPDNTSSIPEIIVVDTLPEEVDFVAADSEDGVGYYDSDLHAYSHVYTALDQNAGTRFWLTVWVHEGLAPGATITNSVLVNGLWTPPVLAQSQVVIKYKLLHVSKAVVYPPSQGGQPASVGIGDTATYRICVDNIDNDFITHNIFVTDILPWQLDFISANSGGVYEPDSRSCTWMFPSLVPGEQVCVDLTVQVNDKAVLDQPIINTVTARSNETPPVENVVEINPIESTLPVMTMELIYSEQTCKDCSDNLQAVLTLPPEIKLRDIDPNVMLMLDPGGSRAGSQIVYGRDGKVKIRAFFDITKLLESVDGYGRVTVTVKGWLYSGRAFIGQRSMLITLSMRHR